MVELDDKKTILNFRLDRKYVPTYTYCKNSMSR